MHCAKTPACISHSVCVWKHVVVLSMAKLYKNVCLVHLSSFYDNAVSDSLTIHLLIPFPVKMWHVFSSFCKWPLMGAVIREVSNWINSFRFDDISIGYISLRIYNHGFWIVFRFGFQFGNNWFGFSSWYPICLFRICLQYLWFGKSTMGLAFLSTI